MEVNEMKDRLDSFTLNHNVYAGKIVGIQEDQDGNYELTIVGRSDENVKVFIKKEVINIAKIVGGEIIGQWYVETYQFDKYYPNIISDYYFMRVYEHVKETSIYETTVQNIMKFLDIKEKDFHLSDNSLSGFIIEKINSLIKDKE